MLRRVGVALGLLVLAGLGLLLLAGRGFFGQADSVGARPRAAARPAPAVAATARREADAARAVGVPAPKQILFGDLHVHSTISFDAFMFSLPVMGGEGAHPPADACDFARWCSALDFWSINDHAENISARDWSETQAAIRDCNARAGDPAHPDTVAFLGWEWTQAGLTPETHYGHKNVVLASTEPDRVPARPIAASLGGVAAHPPGVLARGLVALGGGGRFHDLALRWTELGGMPRCPEAPERELPPDCREVADTPADLFRKLDDWGFDALVIPHGTAWGIYTPPGSTWDKQLVGAMHDGARQTLIEVYSGHGDSEVYRPWRAVAYDADGTPRCPEERPDYQPMCRRAGVIVRARCLAEGTAQSECEARAEQARRYAAAAGVSPQVVVPGTTGADWRDAGQCRDCDEPAFSYRPGSSAQYIAALGDFSSDPARPRHFRMGFIASSDIHSARPGTGYKEVHRRGMTDANGHRPTGGVVGRFFAGKPEPALARSRPYEQAARELSGLQLYETERPASFLYTGGLVAVHAEGRDREAIWRALRRREVYGTSGPRILLWLDLLNPPRGGPPTRPMGSEVAMREAPILQARAVGSFEQQPGCPASAAEALGPEALERLCKGECYHPSDRRRRISRIEIVRIRPQQRPNEDVADLVDDPWRSFACEPDPAGCVVTFTDPEFAGAGRDALYYARAFEEPTPTINAATVRCQPGPDGPCSTVRLCGVGDAEDEECLAPYEPRAWSSPIWVDFSTSRGPGGAG